MDMRFTNVVSKEKLREVQLDTLGVLASVVSHTAGPYGSNTQIINGQQNNEYTKDGHTVLSSVQFYKAIEAGIQKEMKEVTRYIVKTVGDGTTSAVLLSESIFRALAKMENEYSFRPYELISTFQEVVSEMKQMIKHNAKEGDIEDIYNICMISTNGNKEVSSAISEIYKEYGKNVFIDVAVSTDENHRTKSYNGLTLGKGYASPSFINTPDGKCVINKPQIYSFADHIDNPMMVELFKALIYHNIQEPIMNRVDPIPTVIMVPSVTRDINQWLKDIEVMMYSFDETNPASKPPLCIVTQSDIVPYQKEDICTLCGIPEIKMYIDPELYKKDVDEGKAATIDNVSSFFGTCDEFTADMSNSSFKNPGKMYEVDEETGERKLSSIYNGLINFCEKELQNAKDNMEDANVTGTLKRRLNSLKVNFVEYFIGGVTTTDRDSLRAAVEDAVLNCRSAMQNGVGLGANVEAFRAVIELNECEKGNDLVRDSIIEAIYNAYKDVLFNLYSSGTTLETARKWVKDTEEYYKPVNIVTGELDSTVITSIMTDIAILEAISRVITIMFTANQCLIPSPMNNVYVEDDEK